MSETEGTTGVTPVVTGLVNADLRPIEKALETMMTALAGVSTRLETVCDVVAQQTGDIEELRKGTPAKGLRPLGRVIPPESETEDKRDSPKYEQEEDSEFDMYDLRDDMPKKRSERRSSFMARDEVATEMTANARSGDSENDAGVHLLHVQKEVPTHLLVDSISIPALILAKENQQIFMYENGQHKKLVHFITPNAHKELTKNEDNLNTPLSMLLNYKAGHIYTLDDSIIAGMVASTVRHKYTTSRNLLVKTIMGFTRQLKALSPAWRFGIVGYDKYLHQRTVEWMKNNKRAWRYLRIGITVDEMRVWPPERWGSKDTPGLIRIFAEGLGDFEKPFVRAIGEDKLKRLEKVDDFFDLLGIEDKRLCERALKLRMDDAQNEEPLLLKDIRDSLTRPAGPDKIATKPVDDNKNAKFGDGNHSAKYGDANYPTMPGYGAGNRDQTPDQRRGRFARLDVIDEPEATEDGDLSFASDPMFAQVMPLASSGRNGDQDPEASYEVDLMALMARGSTAMGSAGKALYDHKEKKPADPTKPCFVEFKTGCDNKCGGYNHDVAVMEKLAFKTLEDLVYAKYGGPERTKRNLEKILLTYKPNQPREKYTPSKPRVALITGDPNNHPGHLVPAGHADTDDASSETS